MLRTDEAELVTLQRRHNGRDSVSNHQPHDCSLNRWFRRRSKKTSKLRVTGLCEGNSQGTGEFPAQMASYAENVSIRWRHHGGVSPGDIPYCTRPLLFESDMSTPLQWRHISVMVFHINGKVDSLFNRLFKLTSKEPSKFSIKDPLWWGNSYMQWTKMSHMPSPTIVLLSIHHIGTRHPNHIVSIQRVYHMLTVINWKSVGSQKVCEEFNVDILLLRLFAHKFWRFQGIQVTVSRGVQLFWMK